ncbi:MAG TPA: hypothetical protein VF621_14670 [Pyrinomonadaceae bacterium]
MTAVTGWIGLGISAPVVVGALVGLSYLGTTRGAAVAGLSALDRFVNPKAAGAVEVQQDLRAGHYDDREEGGEGDEPGAAGKGLRPTDEGGGDA